MATPKARGRQPWKAPDGVATQPPWQTAKATTSPREGVKAKRSVYETMHLQAKKMYGKVKPGYGKTGRFPC